MAIAATEMEDESIEERTDEEVPKEASKGEKYEGVGERQVPNYYLCRQIRLSSTDVIKGVMLLVVESSSS